MPDYRGTGGTLQGLGEFLQSLAMANDPDKAKREAFQRELLMHPELTTQLQNNPDLISEYTGSKPFFGKNKAQEVKDKILATPLTPDQLAEKYKQGAINSVLQSQDQSNKNIAADVVNQVGGTPSPVTVPTRTNVAPPSKEQRDIFNKSQGLPTTDEQEYNTTRLTQIKGDVEKQAKDTENQTRIRQNGLAAQKYLVQNKMSAYTAFQNIGSLPPEVQSGLMEDPNLQKTIDSQMRDAHDKMMESLTEKGLSDRHNERNYLIAAKAAAAQSLSEKTGMPVTDIYNVLDNGLLGQYRDNNFQPLPNDPHPQLAKVAQGLDAFGGRYNDKQLGDMIKSYNSQLNQIFNSKDAQSHPEAAAERANQLSQTVFGSRGIVGPTYEAKRSFFTDGHFTVNRPVIIDGGDERLKFKVNPTESKATPNTPTDSTGIDIDASAQNVQSVINSGTATYQQAMQNPNIPQAVKAKLRPPAKK